MNGAHESVHLIQFIWINNGKWTQIGNTKNCSYMNLLYIHMYVCAIGSNDIFVVDPIMYFNKYLIVLVSPNTHTKVLTGKQYVYKTNAWGACQIISNQMEWLPSLNTHLCALSKKYLSILNRQLNTTFYVVHKTIGIEFPHILRFEGSHLFSIVYHQ